MMRFLPLLLCVMAGCVQPVPEPPPKPPGPPLVIEPVKDDQNSKPITLSMTASDSLLGTLHETLGASGEVTINPSQPIVIRKSGTTMTVQPGTVLRYDLTQSGGSIVFNDPLPTVAASVWGLSMTPRLQRLDLRPDNTGTAHVKAGPIKLARQFSLGWLDAGTAGNSQPDLPLVRIYSADWCGPCQQAKRELSAAMDLPFRFVIVNENEANFPSWVTALPTMHWQAGDGWRQTTGWSDLPTFLARWRASVSQP